MNLRLLGKCLNYTGPRALMGVCVVMIMVSNAYLLWKYLALADERKDHSNVQTIAPSSVSRVLFDGRFFWDVVPTSKEVILNKMTARDKFPYKLIGVLNKIECMSCYDFHIDHIRQLITTYGLQVFMIASSDYMTFIRRDIPQAIVIPEEAKWYTRSTKNYSHVFLLVDQHGRILCSDISDQTSYEIGRAFYSIVESFLSNE